jgi:hypothetical protein
MRSMFENRPCVQKNCCQAECWCWCDRSPCCAGPQELRDHLKKYSGRPFWEALADFHLLLYLAAQPNFDLASDIR